MLHLGCVKLHQKFRDFVGLPMGLLREENRRFFEGSKANGPGKSRFSGVFLYLNGLIWFDQIWQNESRFHPIFSGPQVVNWLKRGQKEGEVVPKVVNREPIFGVLFSPPYPRFLAVAVWHSLS